ncbi:MAG TPA: hypothetical protein VMI31_04990 [Fimbriimonadaceae bacterium]|nr:hypothetical protein [Fimbriimonadaceae bacterium]
MSHQQAVLIGYANGDVHAMQVMENQEASQIATQEAQELGTLSNAGFRTIVASIWSRDETKTAGLMYAATWNENEIQVLLHFGDRIASSHELYRVITDGEEPLTATTLLRFCHRCKLGG